MNGFQQELQSLNLNDYQSGNVVYWDQLQQNQYPYYYIQDDARRCGGCGGRCGGCGGGRCGGCAGRCGGCIGCAGCFSCFNCWNWWII
ncbi:heterocycloanthracin/sonorensin family bacteriocin [Bacillus wiedmannii]|uniref:Heterocycloanthracin/sonorensin family bacteriocin n=1 Tax=Bacillus wiedmannii TaxID=1890302 RepID=A0A4U3AKF5_9BACI|nr:heterocycloanthracin/sonorensin family bacteriocin [Bacillus wiedmannii]TKH11965.1 heterocycloanthracin/sonorensin family bacteriocin [Bacillus wiedmannii]TKI89226.1 heterocycloanthracin/sonorensin family bacteriocin [Bacillus wiedmannii]